MSKLEFELNRAGVAALMKSANMQKVLEQYATRARNRAGRGYEQDLYVGRNRANARVWAETKEAQSDNYKNNTLLKSVR
jgi:hypothetical protein